MTINSLIGNSLTKAGAGNLTLSTANFYLGGTTVDAGTLTLASGGQTGIIRGTLTINPGATLSTPYAWGLGFGGVNNGGIAGLGVNTININGGTLNFIGAVSDSGIAASTITMTGGTISGPSPVAWYFGNTYTPSLVTAASSVTATVSSGFSLRLSQNPATLANGLLTLNVAQGTTPSGVDLLVSGPIVLSVSDGNDNLDGITKTGLGTVAFSAANTFTGPDNGQRWHAQSHRLIYRHHHYGQRRHLRFQRKQHRPNWQLRNHIYGNNGYRQPFRRQLLHWGHHRQRRQSATELLGRRRPHEQHHQ